MTTALVTRRPGRPAGSSRLKETDEALLAKIGDKVLANPNISTRAAIVQVLGKNDPAALRRLQGKFKPREAFVEAARQRTEAQRPVSLAEVMESFRETTEVYREMMKSLSDQVLPAFAMPPDLGLHLHMASSLEVSSAFEQVREAVANLAPVSNQVAELRKVIEQFHTLNLDLPALATTTFSHKLHNPR